MILTAEEFLSKKYAEFSNLESGNIWVNIEETMIEFAKLHVEAALKEASEKAECNNEGTYGRDGESTDYYVVDKDSILNSYSKSNIK